MKRKPRMLSPIPDRKAPPLVLGNMPNLLDLKAEQRDMREDKAATNAAPLAQDLPQILANMRAMLPQLSEYYAERAKQDKAKFDGLIKAGFTEKQAIALTKKDEL